MGFLTDRRGRVRPLLQLGAADCGPACLRMVLGHFGRHLSAWELSARPVSARDGVTAAWLIDCARRHGLHAEGFEVSSVDELAALPTPAILHTTAAHFVVFEGLARGRVVIVDPSVGERWYLYRDEARDLFSGAAIAFEPAAEFRRRGRIRLKLDLLSPVLAPDWRTAAMVSVAGVALTAASTALGTDRLWSTVLGGPGGPVPTLTVLDRVAVLASVLALVVVPLSRLVDASVRSQVGRRAGAHLAGVLGRGLLADGRGQQRAPHAPAGGAPYLGGLDPRTSAAFPDAFGVVLTASALVGAAFTAWSIGASVPILLTAFCAALLASVVAAHLSSRLAPPGTARGPDGASTPSGRPAPAAHAVRCGHGLLSSAIWLSAFHLDDTVAGLLREAPFPHGMRAIVPPLLLAVATFRVGGAVAVGRQWIAGYERLAGAPSDGSRTADGDAPGATRPADASAPPSRQVPSPAPLLRLRGITLGLGDARDRLLSGLDVDLDDGERVAFVGPAGAGKTTLIRAVLGRVGASSGAILYRGRPLHEHPWPERAQLVRGLVQGDRLPDSTIAKILRAANRAAPPERLRALCARLGFDEELSGLPLGYDTPVINDGDTLSRGQRQMVLLAQAVASEARVLALDDPVNALDDAAARRVLAGLATLPSAVVLTMTSASALCGLGFRVIRLDGAAGEHAGRSALPA